MSKWSIPIDKLARKAGLDVQLVGQQATFSLFQAVNERSPVDTGRFRGNWQFGRNSVPGGTIDRQDPGGTAASAEAVKALTTPLGGVVYYTNNLPYAQRLESGYSRTQAPAGMVRVSVAEFSDYVKAAIR